MVPEMQPHEGEIRKHLNHITRRWHELGEKVWLELVFLSAEDRARVKDVSRFSPDDVGLGMAAWHANEMNKAGVNAYVVVNPVSDAIKIETGKRAASQHIAASFFHWADADDAQAADNIKNFVGPKCTFYVITGTQPCIRPHVYWELEEPARNLKAWEQTQRAIAATLKTDGTVVDPPRIMRLGGTVNWPKPQKLAKGYIAELTTIHIHDEDDRPPVSSERMARAFNAAATPMLPIAAQGHSGPATPPPSGFSIDTGDTHGKTAAEYADILRRARTDGQKHGGVRDLSASLAGMGVSRHAAEAIIREACPVWDEGVERLLDTAYQKFSRPSEAPPPPQAFTAEAAQAEAAAFPTVYDFFDEAALQPRQWVYGRHYLRRFVSVLASAGGVGKTSLQVVEALAICTGRPLLGETIHETCPVWLINLEDPMDEMQRRILAAMRFYGITADQVRGRLFVDAGRDFSMTFAAQTRDGVIPNTALVDYITNRIPELGIGMVFIDPFVGAHQINENDNMAVNAVVSEIRRVADETNCSIGLVHHIRKGNGDDATIDSVRGANSLIGAARAARVINKIRDEDAIKLGAKPDEATGIFRVDDGKANLAPPASVAVYRRMVGVKIDNGEWVGVATEFKMPDEWGGMSADVVNDILSIITMGIPDAEGREEYYSIRPQDAERWAGSVILNYAFDRTEDAKNEAQVKTILRQWIKTGLLEEFEYRSERQRKDRNGLRATGRVGQVAE